MSKADYCYNCGQPNNYNFFHPIDPDLSSTWGIGKRLVSLFDRREGKICQNCGVNIRAQGLAKAILESKFGYDANTLVEWVDLANKHKIKVCELNSCHELHHTFKKLKNLTYAEYGTKTEQDIEALTYKDNSFDLVLHSETLEHVNDPRKAMSECRRVINKNGEVIFTVPIIWTRKTRRRAEIVKGKRLNLLPPSYHGKKTSDYQVFHEYGNDVLDILGVGVCYTDVRNQNYVLYSNKQPVQTHKLKQINLVANQKIIELLGI